MQVTHSEENARYGKRILELRDGWLTRDEAAAAKHQRRSAHSEPFQVKSTMIARSVCGTRAQSIAAILLLQVNLALAVEPRRAQSAAADSSRRSNLRRRLRRPRANSAAAAPPSLAQADAASAAAGVCAASSRFNVPMPHSHNPLAPYRPSTAPPLDLSNSPRLKT